jgi:hypothetical protein
MKNKKNATNSPSPSMPPLGRHGVDGGVSGNEKIKSSTGKLAKSLARKSVFQKVFWR